MKLKEFNKYMDEQFDLLIKKLCPEQNKRVKKEEAN